MQIDVIGVTLQGEKILPQSGDNFLGIFFGQSKFSRMMSV